MPILPPIDEENIAPAQPLAVEPTPGINRAVYNKNLGYLVYDKNSIFPFQIAQVFTAIRTTYAANIRESCRRLGLPMFGTRITIVGSPDQIHNYANLDSLTVVANYKGFVLPHLMNQFVLNDDQNELVINIPYTNCNNPNIHEIYTTDVIINKIR